MSSVKTSDVFTEVPISSLPPEIVQTASSLGGFTDGKEIQSGSDLFAEVSQEFADLDNTYGSTPLLFTVDQNCPTFDFADNVLLGCWCIIIARISDD